MLQIYHEHLLLVYSGLRLVLNSFVMRRNVLLNFVLITSYFPSPVPYLGLSVDLSFVFVLLVVFFDIQLLEIQEIELTSRSRIVCDLQFLFVIPTHQKAHGASVEKKLILMWDGILQSYSLHLRLELVPSARSPFKEVWIMMLFTVISQGNSTFKYKSKSHMFIPLYRSLRLFVSHYLHLIQKIQCR